MNREDYPVDELTARRPTPSKTPESPYLWGVVLFVLTAVLGLYYVKWMPYFHKVLVAATTHSIGASILSGHAAAPPKAGWNAAWSYTLAYAQAVWQALVVGLLVGSGVQALLPRAWLTRMLGSGGFASTAIAGVASVPSMM